MSASVMSAELKKNVDDRIETMILGITPFLENWIVTRCGESNAFGAPNYTKAKFSFAEVELKVSSHCSKFSYQLTNAIFNKILHFQCKELTY